MKKKLSKRAELTIELNEQFTKALNLMENSDKNVFITGKAGTGKSTLLRYFRDTTKKKIVVLAPTGVAALNVEGETIHSFFGFKPDITLQKIEKIKNGKIYKKIDCIVIDEISMVRADLLDCVERFLRLNGKNRNKPFGGTQMIFIGDLYQLPPVVTNKEKEIFKTIYKSPYFFDANVFKTIEIEFIELEKIYRQKDETFINILNAIRNKTVTEEDLALLNSRVNAKLNAKDGYTVQLASINEIVEKINSEHLQKLNKKIYTYPAKILGSFDTSSFPTEAELKIAIGAQVMLLTNDSSGRWVNGTIGKIIDIEPSDQYENDDVIIIQLFNKNIVEVRPYTWEIFHYTFNKDAEMIETETIGTFRQYPLKLAWALTIHKSQGKTFNNVIINLARGTFAAGQMYVALSRCTSLEGISLTKPVKKGHILMDWNIVKFLTKYQYKYSERNMPLEEKLSIIKQAIKEKKFLEITYLKPSDEKSHRIIKPQRVGQEYYLDKPFLGLSAYCTKRKADRIFRVDRILEMKIVDIKK